MTHAWGAPGPHAFVPAAVREARRWVSWAFELPHTVEIYDGPDLGPGFGAPRDLGSEITFCQKTTRSKDRRKPPSSWFPDRPFFLVCALFIRTTGT